jgi:hypothetical protein
MYCSKCGTLNDDNNYKCVSCGQILHGAEQRITVEADTTLGGLIPYKNSPALIAYYLAVFSLIPCVGLILGIPAFILGIRGLGLAKRHPEAKGKAHAWTGVILGGICALLNLAAIVVYVITIRLQ